MIAPPWFRGVWRREWVRYGDGEPFEDRIVRDVQTPSVFGSVRIPINRPAVKSFAEATDAELESLSAQKGFAGIATFEDDIATWHHAIDFQQPETDTAKIVQHGTNTVLEVGLQNEFAELWWNLAPHDSRFLGIEVVKDDRIHELLAVVGDHFVYARNRARDWAPPTTRAELIELLDCELAYGHVRGGKAPWRIALSTLPWREGQSIDFVAVRDAGNILVNTFTEDDLQWLAAR